eukprot:5389886-Pyramimonas_sp.AAC.1
MQYDAYDEHGNKVGALQSSHIIATYGYPLHVRHAHSLGIKWIIHVFLNAMALLGYGNMY